MFAAGRFWLALLGHRLGDHPGSSEKRSASLARRRVGALVVSGARQTAKLLLALLVLLIFACPLPARAAFEYGDDSWEGTSELLSLARQQLGKDRVHLVATLDYAELTPADGVLVLHPDTRLEYDEIAAFLRAGGRLALVDDHGRGDELLSRFQIHRINAPMRPKDALRGNPNLAIAEPAVQVVAGIEQGRHPIVADVDRVITNHATALAHPDLTPVLRIPAVGEPDATVAVTGIINRGRLFAMGDPSTLINLMLRYPGNRAFASGLIAYLVEEDSWGPRGGKLYVLANDFRQRGHYGGEAGLVGQLLDHAEGALGMIHEMHDSGLPAVLAILLATALVVAAAVWTVMVSSRTYRRTRPRYATALPLVAQGGLAGRAAVLSAPTTKGALVVVELKAALEEGLAHHLRVDAGTPRAAVLKQLEEQDWLDKQKLSQLQELLREMDRAETSIAAAQPIKVRPQHVQTMNRQVKEILKALKAHSSRT